MAMKGAPKASYQGSLETNDVNLLGETMIPGEAYNSKYMEMNIFQKYGVEV